MGYIVPEYLKADNTLMPGISGIRNDTSNTFAFFYSQEYKNRIHAFPKNMARYFLEDISTNGVVDVNSEMETPSNNPAFRFMDLLPRITIKEYVPEIPQDQWLNIFGETFKVMEEVFKEWRDNT